MLNEVVLSVKEFEEEEETKGIQSDHDFNSNDNDLLRDLKKQEAKRTSHADKEAQQRVCSKIQKLPKIMKLRDKSMIKEYYTPSEISIGPIHTSNKELTKRDLKLRLAAKFVAESGQSAEILLGRVKNDIDAIKKCFDDSVVDSFKDDKLARILFLDGCSVLQFVHSSANDGLKEFEISNGLVNSIQKDLFLLENQIPFRLLKLLMNSTVKGLDIARSIYGFVSSNIMSPPSYYFERHLRNIITLRKLQKTGIFELGNREPVHLLDLLRLELLFPLENDRDTPTTKTTSSKIASSLNIFYKRSFRNVQDLKTAGIKFKPGDTSSFRGVSFSTRWLVTGELSLPTIVVDNTTATKLWNLVAYEMLPDNYMCDFGISSYLSFMDSLIDNESDVRDLRAEHVLRNRLSSDDDVAKLFNTIGSNLISDDAYLDVKMRIQRHYERKCVGWAAQVGRDHFSSPWTVLALFAATIALLLTGFSTWFTVYPPKDK